MATFAELGISFPLFEAPVDQAASFVGRGRCQGCGLEHHYFHDDVEVVCVGSCETCGTPNEQHYEQRNDKGDWLCTSCASSIPFDRLKRLEKVSRICFACVKARNLMFSKDTEFGLVRIENAETGVTYGSPSLETDQFEVVTIDETWGARIPSSELWELLRTPRYFGWQEERWLFCCRRAMVYLGHWADIVEQFQPKNPEALFALVCETMDADPAWTIKLFESHDPEMYVFRCRECSRLRAYMDMS